MPILASSLGAAGPAAPFALALDREGLKLKASLLNVSGRPQLVLVDRRIQPVRPVLRHSGAEIELEDQRAISKFDAAPLRSLFTPLAPHGRAPAGEGVFTREGAVWRLDWASYSAHRLEPGRYTLAIAWESRIDGWNDDETRAWHPHPELWRGEVVSPPVAIDLPG